MEFREVGESSLRGTDDGHRYEPEAEMATAIYRLRPEWVSSGDDMRCRILTACAVNIGTAVLLSKAIAYAFSYWSALEVVARRLQVRAPGGPR